MSSIWTNYIFLVLPRRNLPGEWLLACAIKAMYIVRCLRLFAEERLFARTIEFGGRLKPDRVERNSIVIYV